MRSVPIDPADRGVDPRQGDLLELLGMRPEQLERSRHAIRPGRAQGGTETSSWPSPGTDWTVREEMRDRGRLRR